MPYSEMTAKALNSDPERKAKVFGKTPLGIMGQATDIGEAANFLASEAAGYISKNSMPEDPIDHINISELEQKAISAPLVTHIYTTAPSCPLIQRKNIHLPFPRY